MKKVWPALWGLMAPFSCGDSGQDLRALTFSVHNSFDGVVLFESEFPSYDEAIADGEAVPITAYRGEDSIELIVMVGYCARFACLGPIFAEQVSVDPSAREDRAYVSSAYCRGTDGGLYISFIDSFGDGDCAE